MTSDDKSYSESAYIAQQRERQQAAREAQAAIDSVVARFRALPESELPPLWMMQTIGSHSAEHFRNTATWSFVELVRRGGLTSKSRVVDIGSGCGRMALPFSLFIKEGAYYGTDVFEEGVDWCTAQITSRSPNFKFFLQRPENNYYFGGDIQPSASLSLGFAETASIDFVFAISVFTHLVEQDAENYLREIARCLKPDGLAYITCFIIDRYFHAYVKRTRLHTAVKEVSPGHSQAYTGQDFFAGYTAERWGQLVAQSGLEIAGFDPGTWAEKPGALHYQDTFLITKSP
jgi:SAM-dependent methyltransferase